MIKLSYQFRWKLWNIKHKLFKFTHNKMFKNPEKYIPQKTPYCYTYKPITNHTSTTKHHGEFIKCPFWRSVPFLPEQQNGYCHYLNKADIDLNPEYNKESFIGYKKTDKDIGKSVAELFGEYFPSSLLWDQCKECGINDDFELEDI
jgi:hypothetical protein